MHLYLYSIMCVFFRLVAFFSPTCTCKCGCSRVLEKEKTCILETDSVVIALFEALVPRQHSRGSAKDSRTHHCQSICTRLQQEEGERGEAGREVGFPLDDWRRGLQSVGEKMPDGGINNGKLPPASRTRG